MLGELYADDEDDCLRGEADLFVFSPYSLEWLACATKTKMSRLKEGDPKVVAATVHTLRKQLARPSLRGRLRNFVKRWF